MKNVFHVHFINPLSAKFIKWSNTLKQIVGKLPTIYLSVFDHFSGLALKGLRYYATFKLKKFESFSQGSDVSNFIGSDQKVAPYQLAVFEVMTPKSDFLLIGVGTIAPNGSMNTADFGKTLLFVE